MENEEKDNWKKNDPDWDSSLRFRKYGKPFHQNNWMPGLIVIIVGVILLLNKIPETANLFPNWLFEWPAILIILGLIGGARHGFRYHFGWLIPIFIGIYFLLKERNLILDKWDVYFFPVFLIIIGLFLLIKRRFGPRPYCRNDMRFYDRMKKRRAMWEMRGRRFDNKHAEFSDNSNENYIAINCVFGSAEKSMFTKAFKGGNISCSFGGAELNLSQADIEDSAVLNISATFGGVEITIPSNWTIQNELTAFMGGIEDKRRASSPTEPPKILILRGNVFCGGIEIKN